MRILLLPFLEGLYIHFVLTVEYTRPSAHSRSTFTYLFAVFTRVFLVAPTSVFEPSSVTVAMPCLRYSIIFTVDTPIGFLFLFIYRESFDEYIKCYVCIYVVGTQKRKHLQVINKLYTTPKVNSSYSHRSLDP